MMKLFPIVTLTAAASLVVLAGCKTVVNNPPPAGQTTVIHDQTPAPSTDQPKVENNIHVNP